MSTFSSHLSKFFVTLPNDPTTMGITCTVIIIIISSSSSSMCNQMVKSEIRE